MISCPENSREILSSAARNVLGRPGSQLSDKEVLALLLDPVKNRKLADVYDIGMMEPLTNCLRQISLTFATKLSHTADSQRQRHRRTPGATPGIGAIYGGSADYMVPMIIRENGRLKEGYDQIMGTIYENVNKALKAGMPKEWALLLLPNAQTIRLIETGDFFDWQHRWKQRLCYRAQEEIFFISVEQVEQVLEFLPEARFLLLAPCGLRQRVGIKPFCPEGKEACGQKVYGFPIEDYKAGRLI